MKLYKKSDLNLDASGLLVSKDGDIILPDISIVDQANELEMMIQQHQYLSAQPEATPMPSLDGFQRMSIKNKSRGYYKVKTPTLDAEFDKAMAIMDEIDGQAKASAANQMLDKFAALIEFVDSDSVVDCGNQLYCFDTPFLGSVLELTTKDVLDAIAVIADFDGVVYKDASKETISNDEPVDSLEEVINGKKTITSDELIDSLKEVGIGIDDFCNEIKDSQE